MVGQGRNDKGILVPVNVLDVAPINIILLV